MTQRVTLKMVLDIEDPADFIRRARARAKADGGSPELITTAAQAAIECTELLDAEGFPITYGVCVVELTAE